MDKNYTLRKRRVFFINEKLEKELGKEYTFDGTHVLKNDIILKECSVWEKKIIIKIYDEALENHSRVLYE
tara:strand:- start:370 stop:579 length:210 start_codon:yes stop_codon:yes gene_type:complete